MDLLARVQAWWQGEPRQTADVVHRLEPPDRPAPRPVRKGTRPAVVHDRLAFVDLLARSAELRFTRRRLVEAIERYESEILPLQANLQAINDDLHNSKEYRSPETEPMFAEYEQDADEAKAYLYGQFGYLERVEQARKRLTATETASSDVWKKIYASTRYWIAHSEPRCFAGLDCDDEFQYSFVNISLGAARLESSRELVRETAQSAAQACQALVAARRDARKQDQAFAPSEDAEARVKLVDQNEKEARTGYNRAREALAVAQAVQIERESNFVDTDLLDVLIANGVWKDVHSPRMSELSNLDMISQHEPEMRTPSPVVPHPIIQDLEYTREQVAIAEGNINELKLNYQRGLVNYLVLYGPQGRERWNESFRQDYEDMPFETILEEEEQMRAEAQANYMQCKAEAKRLNVQDQPFTPPGYAPIPAHVACYPPENPDWIESTQQRQRPKIMKWAAGVARGSPASFRDRASVDLLGSPRRADSWPTQQGSSPTSSRAGLVQRAKNARIAKTKQSTRERNRASRRIWQERLRRTMKQHGRAAKLVGEENGKIDWNSFYPDLDAPPQQEVPVQQVSAQQDAQEQSAEESNSNESYNSNSTTDLAVANLPARTTQEEEQDKVFSSLLAQALVVTDALSLVELPAGSVMDVCRRLFTSTPRLALRSLSRPTAYLRTQSNGLHQSTDTQSNPFVGIPRALHIEFARCMRHIHYIQRAGAWSSYQHDEDRTPLTHTGSQHIYQQQPFQGPTSRTATTRVMASLPTSTMAKDDDAAGGGTEAVKDTGVYGSPSGAVAFDRNPSKRSAGYQTADGGVVLGMPAEIADNDDAAVLDAHKLETTGQEQHTHIPGNQLGGGSLERLSILEVQERRETEVPYCRCGGPYFCERHLRMPEDPSADECDFVDAFPASHPGIWEHHPEISASRKAAILSVNRFYVHFVNSQGNSDAESPDTDPSGWIKTQGELVRGFMLIIKAILPDHRIKFPDAAEALTSDETPITGRDLETDLTDVERDDYFKVLKLMRYIVLGHLSPVEQTQLLMFVGHEQRILRDINCRRRGLSKDPEQNQTNTEKNGGFAWKAFFLHKSMSTCDSEMAVPCPAPPEEVRTDCGTFVEKFRAIWVPTPASASRPLAFLIVTFSSSDLDAMGPDERASYIEVLHSSDARAQDSGNVLIVEGANLLKPGCRYCIDIDAVHFDWSDLMSELKAEQVDGAHGGTEGQSAGECVMHMSEEGFLKLVAEYQDFYLKRLKEDIRKILPSAVPQSERASRITTFPLQTEEANPMPGDEQQGEADPNSELAANDVVAVSDHDQPERVSRMAKRPIQENYSGQAKRSKY